MTEGFRPPLFDGPPPESDELWWVKAAATRIGLLRRARCARGPVRAPVRDADRRREQQQG
jgi:hypothetical protein